ncbi:hypothetical protein MTP99_002133 [Tenebrio molitor]|nr:hypothetical protein MTP99_002133 [Tenebrio molitor]
MDIQTIEIYSSYICNNLLIYLFSWSFSCVELTALVTLAFTGSIGMTMIILACGLPQYKLWWPFFVVLFYVLAPIPTLLARRYTEHQGSSNSCLETAIFITMGLIVSAFALPIFSLFVRCKHTEKIYHRKRQTVPVPNTPVK